jgi:hypothetical protein
VIGRVQGVLVSVSLPEALALFLEACAAQTGLQLAGTLRLFLQIQQGQSRVEDCLPLDGHLPLKEGRSSGSQF